MPPNIDDLVHAVVEEEGLPVVCRDIILNTCYFGSAHRYNPREYEKGFGEIKDRLDDMIRNFLLNSTHGILQNYKYLLGFLLVLQENVKQQDVGSMVLPWNDKQQMKELLDTYVDLMQIEVENVWDGKNRDETVRAIYDDVRRKKHGLRDSTNFARSSFEPDAPVEYQADPGSCETHFSSDFWESLVFTIRLLVKHPGEQAPPLKENQDRIIGNCLTKFYESGIVDQTGMTYDIQSLVKHHVRGIEYVRYADPVFQQISHLYASSKNRPFLNNVLIYTGTHSEVFVHELPRRNEGELSTEGLFYSFKTHVDKKINGLDIFAKEDHEIRIQSHIAEYVLGELKKELFPQTPAREKRSASDVSDTGPTMGKRFTGIGVKPPAGSQIFRQEEPEKKKEGSGNTFLIIALLLIAVGIVVFFV